MPRFLFDDQTPSSSRTASRFLCQMGFHRFVWKRGVFRCVECHYSVRGPKSRDPFVMDDEDNDTALVPV